MYTKQKKCRDKARLVDFLQFAGIRATRQRLDLASLLFDGTHKHVSAEQVRGLLQKRHISISLATIYNSLHQFTEAGLLREVTVDPAHAYFDTNMEMHFHFFDEITRKLIDIPSERIAIGPLPKTPPGRKIGAIDLILRLSEK